MIDSFADSFPAGLTIKENTWMNGIVADPGGGGRGGEGGPWNPPFKVLSSLVEVYVL